MFKRLAATLALLLSASTAHSSVIYSYVGTNFSSVHNVVTQLPQVTLAHNVTFSLTLDSALARKLEPRAASPARRLRTIRTLAEAGVPVGVSVAPQIPFINEDMERVLEAAAQAGASSAFYTVLRLPWELAPLFRQWLELHYPQRADRVMARVQDMRGGKDYDSSFASRMKGQGLWADLLKQRFEKTCARLGLNRQRVELDLSLFRPASRVAGQGMLF